MLKDNPEQPKYIQTVTNQGYKFIADVQTTRTAYVPAPEQFIEKKASSRSGLILLASALGVAVIAAGLYIATWRSARTGGPL